VTINSIRNTHGCDDLIPSRTDSDPNNWRDIPVSFLSLGSSNPKDDEADDCKQEAEMAEPEAVFRAHWGSVSLLGANQGTAHPYIAGWACELLAYNATYYYAEELETDLLGVEAEFGDEDLGDFDGEEDGGKAEDDCLEFISTIQKGDDANDDVHMQLWE
jgi:hypothetical protein